MVGDSVPTPFWTLRRRPASWELCGFENGDRRPGCIEYGIYPWPVVVPWVQWNDTAIELACRVDSVCRHSTSSLIPEFGGFRHDYSTSRNAR